MDENELNFMELDLAGLFSMQMDDVRQVIDQSSLFNLQNMKQLVNLVQSTPPNTPLEGAGWTELTERLNLPTVRHLEAIWFWLDANMQVRNKDQLSPTSHFLARKGSKAFRETMQTMSLEVPLVALAEEFVSQTKNMTCLEIFSSMLGLTKQQAGYLCSDTEYFRFDPMEHDGRFKSALALVNVYLYADQFNPEYFREFSSVLWPNPMQEGQNEAKFDVLMDVGLTAAVATMV